MALYVEHRAGGKQAKGKGVDKRFQLNAKRSLNQRIDWNRLTHEVNVASALQQSVGLLCRRTPQMGASKHSLRVRCNENSGQMFLELRPMSN